ncbi:hypothetical protein [Haloglomus litoreum]|uniref:hypothetical protein n=1 Tax=Haloglomus litoreum TaxID=3034026 RepID=UPI0023E7B446|nr:hypothetical protein [Haloglomus sp. DT116]
MPGKKQVTRRAALGLMAGGGLLATSETLGFSNVTAGRGVSIETASDANALVGIELRGPVQKNKQDPMVDITNTLDDDATVTVSLNTCSDGTLYDPQNDSGCSVTFPVLQGNTATVDIEAAVGNTTVPFTIQVSAPRSTTPTEFSFTATREVTAEAGNVKSAVEVKQVKKFSANANGNSNDWGIGKVQVQDKDGDKDLDRVEYEITDSSGTTRATRTDSASGKKYDVKKITIQPDDPDYQLQSGETYTLDVVGYDADGNTDSETKTATA